MAPKDELMNDDERPSRNEEAPEAKKKGGKGGLLLILIGVVVLITVPAATFFLLRGDAGSEDGEGTSRRQAPQVQPVVVAIEPLVVNISGTRMTRVLRMQVHLVLSEPRLEEVIKEMNPMVKDRIMSTSARRTLDELEGVDDRESLKRDIALEINSLIRSRMSGSVLDVAFSEFLIQ